MRIRVRVRVRVRVKVRHRVFGCDRTVYGYKLILLADIKDGLIMV